MLSKMQQARRNSAAIAVTVTAFVLCPGHALGQFAPPAPRFGPASRRAFPEGTFPVRPATAKAQAADAEADASQDQSEAKFPGGAALKTDPEQQRLLKRAAVFVQDGRLDLAAVLWQKVLDEAGDTLITRDGRTYTSLAEEVERTLVDPKLPAQALATYRITADGDAQALLSRAIPGQEEEALAAVVRRYFLSSHGDDAAYKLACLALDRFDFVGASRLFSKILDQHPDTSIPQSEILLRQAVASARMGDRETASAALTALRADPGIAPPSSAIEMVEDDLARTAQASLALAGGSSQWHMSWGNAARNARMPALPPAVTSRTLAELWVHESPLAGPPNAADVAFGGAMDIPGRQRPQEQAVSVSREQIVSQWRQNGWMPTPQLLFDGGRVYVKTPDGVACFRATAEGDPVWRSAWRNQYELDGMSQMYAMMAANMGLAVLDNSQPRTAAEILLFGDRVHQSMSIAAGVLYSIEGRQIKPGQPPQATNSRGFQWGVTPRRTRTNWLAAYHAQGGAAVWRRGASDEDQETTQDVGFLAAPVPYGNLLLVPVTDGGTIWLYAIAAGDGKTVWKSYLCDEPSGGADPWSPVTIAVDGRDAYLTCGSGVAFAIDAVSGMVRWAVRYERAGKPRSQVQTMYGNQAPALLDPDGWDDDVAIPHGRTLVVLSSDSNRLLAFDRRNGAFRWDAPRASPFGTVASYCLGVAGQGVFVAGPNVVRRYDIPSGRLVWEREIDISFGRGVLTDDAIYVPVKDSIVKLDLDKGRELLQVGVALTTDDPVGSLFSDGEKLWATGAGRVYAMTNLEHRFEILELQIASGDADAQFNRMRLHAKQKNLPAVVADLRGAFTLLRAQRPADEAAQKLFAAIGEVKLPQQQPEIALQLLSELLTADSPPIALGKDAAGHRADLIATSLHVVRQKRLSSATSGVLALAPLLDQEYLLSSAAQTLDAIARRDPDTIAALQAAVKGSAPEAQIIAAAALAKIAPEAAKPSLASLLASADDRVRLAGARALANLGDRAMLSTFAALLESDNPRVRARSHQSLRAMTGQQIAFASEATVDERRKAAAAWKKWIVDEGPAAKLALPLPHVDVPLGRILFTSHVHGLVIELNANRKEVWKQQVTNPWGCQGLPNGHRVVAAYSQRMVLEYNDEGKEVWRKENLPGAPFSVQRLENGNTLVACADVQQIVEISPDGEVTAMSIPGRPMFAHRLDNGNTLVALQEGNRVVELNPAQQTVWEARNLHGPCFAARLENGNTLVVQQFTNQVSEIDRSGQKTVWLCKVPLVSPMSAQRLTNGNTLISDQSGIREIDPSGEQIRWHHQQQHVSGVSSF